MSDMGYDPYQDVNDGDLMAMYSQMNPQLFGDDPTKRLNYYQDLMSTLGTDLVQTAGVTNPAAEQYQEPMNQTGAIYGSDPFYASIFQAIEEGRDPITAAKLARDQIGFKGTPEEFNSQVVSVATQYAGERVKSQQDRSSWEAENAGGFSMPDGSKYKQTPLGGNDVRGLASEYDLTGMNQDDLFKQYQERMGVGGARGRINPGQGLSMSAGPERSDGFGWTAAQGNPQGAAAFDKAVSGVPADFWAGGTPPSSTAGSGSQGIQPRQPKPTGERGAFFKKTDQLAQDSIGRRVDQSKNNMVRSDANRNLMRRITALAGLLQGKFPE